MRCRLSLLVVAVSPVVCVYGAGADAPAAHKPDQPAARSEVVNGLRIDLESRVRPDGQPKLTIHVTNAGREPLDFADGIPMFLEVQERPGHWRSYQHPRCGSDKLGKRFAFEPGHHESETEPVAAFTTLPAGKHRVRVSLSLDRGMAKGYDSARLWTGVVRSNVVEVSVP